MARRIDEQYHALSTALATWHSPHRKDLLELASYYKDLDDSEFEALAESWRSSDELNRYADLQDKIVLDRDPLSVVQ